MKKGIDISRYQVGLDISECKRQGIDFIILRGGYTSNGSNRVPHLDPLFTAFYTACKKNEMPVGVYYYSCAKCAADGEREARFLYDTCLKGRKFEYPIYIDCEDMHMSNAGSKKATEAVIAFCDHLEKRGYYVGVYASHYFYSYNLIPAKLQRYTTWLAWYRTSKPITDYKYHIWQYTGSGKIGKITVDRDRSYIDFPDVIKKAGLNGYGKI